MQKLLAFGLVLSFQLLLSSLTEPAQAQSWSAWKQLAQEQTEKGQLAQAESSWSAAYRSAREYGAKDSRLYISALELAKIQVSEKKYDDARRLLKEVCKDELLSLGLVCDEEVSCLQTYQDLLKETQDKVEKERIEKLFAQVSARRSSSSQAGKPVSLLFGEAVHEELKKKISHAQELVSQKDYAAAEPELSEALASAAKTHRSGTMQLVLAEQIKLYNAMKDLKKVELASRQLLEVIKQESGIENKKYLDALGAHAKLLHTLGENNRAAIEDTQVAIISSKLKTSPLNQSSTNTGNTSPAASTAPKFDPASIGGSFKRVNITLGDLMAEADKGSNDPNLLKFVAATLYRNKNYERCLPYVQRLATLEPDSARNQLFLSGVYSELHRSRDSIDAAKRAISLSPDADSYSNLISVYAECGDMSHQLDALKEFVSRFPNNTRTHDCQTEIQHLEVAIKESEKSEYSRPTDSELAKCWKKRISGPVKVFLLDNTTADQVLIRPDGTGARHPRELCQDALEAWSSTSGGRVSFSLGVDQRSSEIVIGYLRQGDGKLAESCAAGMTTWPPGYANALVYLGLVGKDGYAIGRDQFYATALHEIGHALGLEHSNRPDDVMFWQEHSVEPKAPSNNDQRRITALYGN